MSKKHKKDKVRPLMPVQKPNNSHMPICSTVGCNRRLTDARKTKCPKCSSSFATTTYITPTQITNFYGSDTEDHTLYEHD